MFQLLTSVLDLLNVIFTTFFTLELFLKIGAFGIRVRNLLLCNLFYPGIFPWSLEFFWFPYCDWVSCGYLHESTSGELSIFRIGFFASISIPPAGKHDISFLLPPLPCPSSGQTALQGRRNPNSALHLCQVLPSSALGRRLHCHHLLHIWSGWYAGE